MIYNYISIYLFIAVVATVYFIAYIQTKGGHSYVRFIFYLGLVVCVYMIGYAAEIMSYNFETALFWNKVEYLGIPYVSALWLTVSLMYTNKFYPLKVWKILLIFLIPLISMTLRWTNDWHHLYFQHLTYAFQYNRLVLVRVYGIWYYVQIIHSGILVITAFYLYMRYAFRRGTDDLKKIRLMMVVSFFAVFGLILGSTSAFDLNLDIMALFLPFTVIGVALSVIRHDFLEIKTMTRNHIFEHSNNGMILINNKEAIIDYNEYAKWLFDQQSFALEREMIVIEQMNSPFYQFVFGKESGTYSLAVNDTTMYLEMVSQPVINENGVVYGTLKVIRDITEKEELMQDLKEQATIDALSGVLNRRAFMEASESLYHQMLIEKKSLALIMMDVDHFKKINDQYGHHVGDRVIDYIGLTLRGAFREKDIVGRIGGEEFAVVLYGFDQKEAEKKAETIRKLLDQTPFVDQDHTISVTVSIGVAITSHSGITFSELMINADRAMYISKNSGRNRVTCYINDTSRRRYQED